MQRISLKIGEEYRILQCSVGKSIITGVKFVYIKIATGLTSHPSEKNDIVLMIMRGLKAWRQTWPKRFSKIFPSCVPLHFDVPHTDSQILKQTWTNVRASLQELNFLYLEFNVQCRDVFVWFDFLRPINNLSVIYGRVFLGWTSTKLGLMCLAQWLVRLEPAALGLESSTLPLSHCAHTI